MCYILGETTFLTLTTLGQPRSLTLKFRGGPRGRLSVLKCLRLRSVCVCVLKRGVLRRVF